MRRVVITGLGCFTPAGDVERSWQTVLLGKSWIKKNTKCDCSFFKSKIASFVDINDSLIEENLDKISIREKKRMDDVSYIAILSTYDALKDAKMICEDAKINENKKIEIDAKIDKMRFGTFIGSGFGGIKTGQNEINSFFRKGNNKISPLFLPSYLLNMASGNVAIKFDLFGANISNVSACATSSHSIGEAFNYIRTGRLDYCVAGGSEVAVCETIIAGFDSMNALSSKYNEEPNKASRPLDKNRDGFVIGEGGAVLILEELESAKRRGAKIYCEIVGYGASCDAYHITSPEPNGLGASRAINNAINDANISINDINYINLHGTSTNIGDIAEIKAIKNTFGEYYKNICISSTKSTTGHLLGSAGAIEAIFCAKAIAEQIIPPSINIDNLDDCCENMNIIQEKTKSDVNFTLSNSFGFGGTNGCLIFKKYIVD